MGCGQSQFSLLTSSRCAGKDSKKDDDDDDDSDDENDEDKPSDGRLVSNVSMPNLVAALEEEEENQPRCSNANNSNNNQTEMTCNNGGSLFAHKALTTSQEEFFHMLDEKIENGPDYDETSEREILLENNRIRHLLIEWERAKQRKSGLVPSAPSCAFNQMHQVVQTGDFDLTPRKYRIPTPAQMNGELCNRMSAASYVKLSQPHLQYPSQSNLQNPYMLNNSVVLYDQIRGEYYTELA